jgi:hypothetical protein
MSQTGDMPSPTSEDLESPVFNAIWDVVKGWDVNVPEFYDGYCGANGSHVKLILNALERVQQPIVIEIPKPLGEDDILHVRLGISDMGDGLPPWLPTAEEMENVRKQFEAIVPEGAKVIVTHFGVETEVIPTDA